MQSLRRFTEMALLLSRASVAALFLPEPGGAALRARCVIGVESQDTPPVPVGRGFAGRTAQSGSVSAFARDVGGSWPGDEVPGSIEAGRQSVLSVPLVAQNVCIGVLEVFDKPRFEQEDVEALSKLGAILATSLDLFNATQMADALLLRALKLATDAEQTGSAQTSQAAKQAFRDMAETVRQIDLVGSGERAWAIAEQIRQLSEFGPEAKEFVVQLLAGLLAMLRTQRGAAMEIKI
jgi:GAF domain-containing protein